LRDSAQGGGVAGRGGGAPGYPPAGGVFIHESGDEPIPADADRDAVCGGVRALDLRAEYSSLRVTYEQWEHEHSSGDSHESLGVTKTV
jgi:hypothetical protein